MKTRKTETDLRPLDQSELNQVSGGKPMEFMDLGLIKLWYGGGCVTTAWTLPGAYGESTVCHR
jgi:hypothetical protein